MASTNRLGEIKSSLQNTSTIQDVYSNFNKAVEKNLQMNADLRKKAQGLIDKFLQSSGSDMEQALTELQTILQAHRNQHTKTLLTKLDEILQANSLEGNMRRVITETQELTGKMKERALQISHDIASRIESMDEVRKKIKEIQALMGDQKNHPLLRKLNEIINQYKAKKPSWWATTLQKAKDRQAANPQDVQNALHTLRDLKSPAGVAHFTFRFGSVILLLVAFALIMDASRKLETRYAVGARIRQECGSEYMEVETERYAVYQGMVETKEISRRMIHVLQLLRATMLASLLSAVLVMWLSRDVVRGGWLRVGEHVLWVAALIAVWGGHWRKNDTSLKYQMPVKSSLWFGVSYTLWIAISFVALPAFVLWIAKSDLLGVDESVKERIFVAWFVFVLAFVGHVVYTEQLRLLLQTTQQDYMEGKVSRSQVPTTETDVNKKGLPAKIKALYDICTAQKTEHRDAFLHYFGQRIRSAVPDSKGTNETLVNQIKPENLWKYVLQSEGKSLELKEILDSFEKTDATTQTTVTSLIQSIRDDFNDLRMWDGITKTTQKHTQGVWAVVFVLFTLLLYILFHYAYRVNAQKTVILSSMLVLVLLVIAAMYGWIVVAMR